MLTCFNIVIIIYFIKIYSNLRKKGKNTLINQNKRNSFSNVVTEMSYERKLNLIKNLYKQISE